MSSPDMRPTETRPTETQPAPPAGSDTRAPVDLGYETRDVNIRAILWLGAGTVIGAVVVHVALWFLMERFNFQAQRNDPELSPLAEGKPEPPGPRLQDEPNRDYARYRADEEKKLTSHGWVDEQQKIARIPVSRAMDIILEHGLPEPKAQEPDASEPTQDAPKLRTDQQPADTSSGEEP